MKVMRNGVQRPHNLKMLEYTLVSTQEKLLAAALEDLIDPKATILERSVRLSYWVKRIWDEGKKEGRDGRE